MANPTYNAVALTSAAPSVHMGQPQPRLYFEDMPDVNGQYVQTHGYGSRDWTITGFLHATTQVTRALALAAIKTAVRTVQAEADGNTVGAFVDADGATSYSNCVLVRYVPALRFYVIGSGTAWVGKCRIQALVRELCPE